MESEDKEKPLFIASGLPHCLIEKILQHEISSNARANLLCFCLFVFLSAFLVSSSKLVLLC